MSQLDPLAMGRETFPESRLPHPAWLQHTQGWAVGTKTMFWGEDRSSSTCHHSHSPSERHRSEREAKAAILLPS